MTEKKNLNSFREKKCKSTFLVCLGFGLSPSGTPPSEQHWSPVVLLLLLLLLLTVAAVLILAASSSVLSLIDEVCSTSPVFNVKFVFLVALLVLVAEERVLSFATPVWAKNTADT